MSDKVSTAEKARAALAQAEQAKLKLAEAGRYSPGRHLAAGLVFAILPAVPILPDWAQMPGGILYLVGAMVIATWDKRRHGVFLSGQNMRGPSRAFVFLCVVALVGLTFLQGVLLDSGADRWASYAVVTAAFLLGIFASIGWARLFRRAMGAND